MEDLRQTNIWHFFAPWSWGGATSPAWRTVFWDQIRGKDKDKKTQTQEQIKTKRSTHAQRNTKTQIQTHKPWVKGDHLLISHGSAIQWQFLPLANLFLVHIAQNLSFDILESRVCLKGNFLQKVQNSFHIKMNIHVYQSVKRWAQAISWPDLSIGILYPNATIPIFIAQHYHPAELSLSSQQLLSLSPCDSKN